MTEKIKNIICDGDLKISNIAVSRTVPNAETYIYKKGSKMYDRFFYIAKGTFYITEKGKEPIVASKGSVVYLPPDIDYISSWELGENEYISFNCLMFGNGKELHLSEEITLILKETNGETENILNKCYETYIQNQKFSSVIIFSLFYRLLYLILKYDERKYLKKDDRLGVIYKAIIYLEDNYMKAFSTEDLAKMCNVSVSTFRNLFKKYKGVSPMKYKTELKLEHAKNLLESNLYTISEVSDIIGCVDISHFNKLYKSKFNKNPSDDKNSDLL